MFMIFLFFFPCCTFIRNSRFQRLYRIGNSHYQVGCHLPGLQCSAFVYVVDQKTHQFDCFSKILVRLQILDLAALGCAEADLPGLQQCFGWLGCRPKKWFDCFRKIFGRFTNLESGNMCLQISAILGDRNFFQSLSTFWI